MRKNHPRFFFKPLGEGKLLLVFAADTHFSQEDLLKILNCAAGRLLTLHEFLFTVLLLLLTWRRFKATWRFSVRRDFSTNRPQFSGALGDFSVISGMGQCRRRAFLIREVSRLDFSSNAFPQRNPPKRAFFLSLFQFHAGPWGRFPPFRSRSAHSGGQLVELARQRHVPSWK